MKFKCKTLMKFLNLGCFLMTLQIHLTHAHKQTIQLFPQVSDVFRKTGSEAEMAYFTQAFAFVNNKDEFGNSMLNFLKKYLEIRKGKQVSRNRHWKNEKNDIHFKYRGNHCHNYLADDILLRSGIQYDPDQEVVTEDMTDIQLDYYTYDTFNLPVLRCPVLVHDKLSYLYFMNFTNDENKTDSSYFLLASKPSSAKLELRIVMYTNRRKTKFNNKVLLVPASLPSVDEDGAWPEDTGSTIPEDGEIDFRKLLIVPDKYLREENSAVTLFGKDAERVFITSNSFHFIDLGLKNSFVDKFIQLIQKMKKGQDIKPFVGSIRQFNNAEFKTNFCVKSIECNAALQFRNIIPAYELSSEIAITTKKTIFPRTLLPEINFHQPMLECPALVGEERKPIIIYVQFVPYILTIGKCWIFSLLKSRQKHGTVYPVTLTQQRYDFSDPLVRQNIEEEIPSIYEDEELGPVIEETQDEELGPVIEETQAEASTSSTGYLPET